MKKNLLKILIMVICLSFNGIVFAEAEEEVIVVTNVEYTASLTKKPSSESGSIDPVNGTHPGLSSVFTLQTNGGDEHFEYIINSSITTTEGVVSGFSNDRRLLFAHTSTLPDAASYNHAKFDNGNSKNIFAYPTNLVLTNGRTYTFKHNYKDYGDCYQIYASGVESGDVTLSVAGTPIGTTYEAGLDEAGAYKSTIVFTITSK